MASPQPPLAQTSTSSSTHPPSSTILVTNLSDKVSQEILSAIFSIVGPLLSTTLIPPGDKSSPGTPGTLSGVVTYANAHDAERALEALQGRAIFDQVITVSRPSDGGGQPASASGLSISTQASSFNLSSPSSPPTSTGVKGMMMPLSTSTSTSPEENEMHVFVGNLSQDVDESVLMRLFDKYASQIKEARVIRDPSKGRSRGFGFLTFFDKQQAEDCIATMNGECLFDRVIKVNHASSPKTASAVLPAPAHLAPFQMPIKVNLGMPPTGGSLTGTPITYKQALAGSSEDNTTLYVGNLVPYCGADDLAVAFAPFGIVYEVRLQSHKGFAFVRLDTHEHAAAAIVSLAGAPMHGRPMKLGWAKNRTEALLRHWPMVALQPPSSMPGGGMPHSFVSNAPTATPPNLGGAPNGAPPPNLLSSHSGSPWPLFQPLPTAHQLSGMMNPQTGMMNPPDASYRPYMPFDTTQGR